MSRLWSRVAARVLAVVLLLVGVIGGVYLGNNRNAQQRIDQAGRAALVEQAEIDELQQRNEANRVETSDERSAQMQALAKALAAAQAAAARARALEEKARRQESASRSEPRVDIGPIPASCNVYSGNRKIGCALLLEWGFGLDQMPCLDKLWTKESGWTTTSTNSSSGAYGIPQALPASKLGKYGSDWRTNPATQIKWGLDYIKGRYTDPCGAWSFFLSHNWY
ncbi:MAG TPA: lytic transglycosylase domain-containing protein [Micromonosporaceae bacterium]|nr:lytic transglycosylase domain-containing protein [Micromonosporaceae bacterium]